MEDIKVVMVGDGNVGKTSLLISYTTNRFPEDHIPTIFEYYSSYAVVNNNPVRMNFLDTSGEKDYQELNVLGYNQADVFVVVFSVSDPNSFKNVKKFWIPEIRKYDSTIPILLIANKIDKRDEGTETSPKPTKKKETAKQFVSTEKISRISKKYKLQFIEVSAYSQKNLHTAMQMAAELGMQKIQRSIPKKKSLFSMLKKKKVIRKDLITS